jgi:RNA ligase (TIGR02306 family)
VSDYCVPTTQERTKSTHKVEVVPLQLEKHPNADRLSVARVYGFTCVTATDQWAGADRAAYIPPDSLVDVTKEEFSFLLKDAKADGKARIKAKKLRGVLSFGLLVPAPAGAQVGDDVAAVLGVEHYEPPVGGRGLEQGGIFMGGEVASPPDVYCVKYDLDAGRRYALQVFQPGEPVVITEKIHGANARYVYHDGQMYCGSRTEWKKEFPNYDHLNVDDIAAKLVKANQAKAGKMGWEELTESVAKDRAAELIAKLKATETRQSMWWQALADTPELRAFCQDHPDVVVYGEVYGAVQDLNYGKKKGEVAFAAFDLMWEGRFMDAQRCYDFLNRYDVPTVPVLTGFEGEQSLCPRLTTVPFDFDKVCEMAEGPSTVPSANHVREGAVVRPLVERWDERLGRVCLKWVGAGYLEKSKGA